MNIHSVFCTLTSHITWNDNIIKEMEGGKGIRTFYAITSFKRILGNASVVVVAVYVKKPVL